MKRPAPTAVAPSRAALLLLVTLAAGTAVAAPTSFMSLGLPEQTSDRPGPGPAATLETEASGEADTGTPVGAASSARPSKGRGSKSPAGGRTLQQDCAAAEQGDSKAAFAVARRYLSGLGVRRDPRVGMAWMRAAASRGHAEAQRLVHYIPGRMGRIRPWCRAGAGPLRAPVQPPAEIIKLVNELAPQYGLDPQLVLAVIQVESAFLSNAVSSKEAAGLMQLIPETAERFAVRDVFNPEDNVRGGMKYLRWLLAYFQGDVTLTMAAYNAGEGAVDRYRGIPPYAETKNYVALVRNLYATTRHPFDPTAASASPVLGTATAPASR